MFQPIALGRMYTNKPKRSNAPHGHFFSPRALLQTPGLAAVQLWPDVVAVPVWHVAPLLNDTVLQTPPDTLQPSKAMEHLVHVVH